MIAYVLDKEISGEKILQDIQKLIVEFKNNSPESIPILYIDIKTITREDTTLIPKIEHHSLEPDCLT
jgi:hypothetical protein